MKLKNLEKIKRWFFYTVIYRVFNTEIKQLMNEAQVKGYREGADLFD